MLVSLLLQRSGLKTQKGRRKIIFSSSTSLPWSVSALGPLRLKKKNVNEEIGYSGGYRADLRTQEKVRKEDLL